MIAGDDRGFKCEKFKQQVHPINELVDSSNSSLFCSTSACCTRLDLTLCPCECGESCKVLSPYSLLPICGCRFSEFNDFNLWDTKTNKRRVI